MQKIEGLRLRRGIKLKDTHKIMNLLKISTSHSRSNESGFPILRTAFRKERKNRHKPSQTRAQRHSQCLQRVRLKFFQAEARTVNIAGSFNDWRPGSTWMIPLGNGQWVKELLLPPGRYEYCFVVDGHWMTNRETLESNPNRRGNRNLAALLQSVNGNGHARCFVLQPQPHASTP